MSLNLLDILKDQVTGQIADKAGSFLGESSDNVSSALGGIFPSLLGSMIDKGSSPEGAKGLMGMIDNVDGGILDNIGGLFGGGSSAVNGLMNSGGGIIESLLGNKLGGVIEMVTKMSGMKNSSVGSLIKLAAPFLIGKIGKMIAGKGISGLMDLLSGQKKNVAAAMPSGMGGLLGLSSFGDMMSGAKDVVSDAADKVGDTGRAAMGAAGDAGKKVVGAAGSAVGAAGDAGKAAVGAAGDVASSGLGFLKWLLPILLLGALAYFLATKGCKGTVDSVKDAAGEVTDAAGDAAGAAGDMVKDGADAIGDAAGAIGEAARGAFAKVDDVAKAALDKITFAAGSAGQQMMDFIGGGEGNGTFRFNNLTFATGSAAIDQSSAAEVDNIAAIMKAYPGVNVRVDGHTDSTGNADSNMQLSQARAEAVKGRLIAQGIDASRLSAKGFGQDSPVATNDTQEGRDQNKRVEVTIVTE